MNCFHKTIKFLNSIWWFTTVLALFSYDGWCSQAMRYRCCHLPSCMSTPYHCFDFFKRLVNKCIVYKVFLRLIIKLNILNSIILILTLFSHGLSFIKQSYVSYYFYKFQIKLQPITVPLKGKLPPSRETLIA